MIKLNLVEKLRVLNLIKGVTKNAVLNVFIYMSPKYKYLTLQRYFFYYSNIWTTFEYTMYSTISRLNSIPILVY